MPRRKPEPEPEPEVKSKRVRPRPFLFTIDLQTTQRCQALEEIREHYQAQAPMGRISASDIVRTLIETEYRRIFQNPK